MNTLLALLAPNARRGSKPRCHLMTHGTRGDVAARLTQLIAPFGIVTPDDNWMPDGFANTEEAQLHTAAKLLPPTIRKKLLAWWLAVGEAKSRTPNWDLASTCTIDGKQGILLVEAKSHEKELLDAAKGRALDAKASEDGNRNRDQIGACIAEANAGLSQATSLPWNLSRDTCYQMSNRFAWSWKLTELGYPVVLVYLGFLNADEMVDQGQPFKTPSNWEQLVMSHSQPLFPSTVWGQTWPCCGQTLTPLIRTSIQPL